ncbi:MULTISPECIES: SDR family NAD(P)-dependent oxidoreductase [Photorhabdus]|uniref:SDR family oxidoreductase n=2 Tax=Photorhabdus TaxID=29487 RepID=A0ABX0AZE5_9GAMM|nr:MULTISPECIES: SDR family oxidoreductase [Photorhabdus]MCC8372737.1 SDR family oxidoreductase [Photorhabdus bodei]MCC8463098.1 SDR family oxidoreductase [Photorhabdus bodei]MCT8352679.1 SDR family oxidoreductase [Photorhabdus kayaii]MDB6366806.1 SDR family oxidoreductase [Photorhabdus bodei]MDB6374336.1 SDR family oxidoreductase [Photorhabdus bodei]
MRRFENKRVVVTGGASGIGEATARRFASEGARVAVIDLNEMPLIDETYIKYGGELFLVCNICCEKSVANSFATIRECWGGIDILVNNAGISIRHQSFRSISSEAWNKVINTNLNGLFNISKAALDIMHEGVIVNTASVNALGAFPHYADYNASKGAIVSLTRTMAIELAPKIRVVSISPGAVLTPMQLAEYTPEMIEEVNKGIPLGRHARPEEIAAMTAFLCSDEAAFITGQNFIIDGGETAK